MIKKIRWLISLIKPYVEKVNNDNLFAIAGHSAFFFILAVVPLTMFGLSVLQSFRIPVETLEEFLGLVLNEMASSYVSEFLGNFHYDTSGISVITLVVTLWSAAQGIHAIINGFNRIHGTHENRNWLFQRLRAIVVTLILIVILVATMMVFVWGASINAWLTPQIKELPEMIESLYNLRYFLVYIYLILIFALMYQKVPNLAKEVRRDFGFRSSLPGAVLSATAWFAMSVGISVYVDDFNGFSIYGGLTRLAIIMVWLYMCILFLMLGAELNFVYHRVIRKYLVRPKNITLLEKVQMALQDEKASRKSNSDKHK